MDTVIMDHSVINTIISSAVSLIVAFGTWHLSMKRDREKSTAEIKGILDVHREEYLGKIQDVKEDISHVKTDMQTQTTVIDLRISELKEQVQRHNEVIDRTYKLEQQSALHEDQIKRAEDRLGKIESGNK